MSKVCSQNARNERREEYVMVNLDDYFECQLDLESPKRHTSRDASDSISREV